MSEAPEEPSEEPLPISVVISSRNRPAMLLDTVNSVLAAHRVPAEVIVVDQGGAARAELAAFGTVRGCAVRYLPVSTVGLSTGRNTGLRSAAQDVVVVLDDDTFVEAHTLERLVAPMATMTRDVVTTGRLLAAAPDAPGLRQAPAALVERAAPEVFRGRQPRQVVPGPNIAVPRRLLLELGGYDERLGAGTRFPAGEDHDLSLRLLDAGCEVRHVPEAIARHRAWRTERQLVRLRWGYARGVGGFYAKHASFRDRYTLRLAAANVRSRAVKALRSIVSSPKTSVAELVSMAGLLTGAAEWTLRYRVLRLARRSS